MPILKPIAGHTNCQGIQRYLEKNGRALAHDFFNLSWDEREDDDDEELKSEVRWADEMDLKRHAKGNDQPFGDMRARTYKHFVLSPDPEDGIDLPALRELACAWTLKHFGDFQVAIVYHDDNQNGIPHAHIVVNNTNLVTGRRLHTNFPLDLNRELQDMARERGLLHLSNEEEHDEGIARLADKGKPEQQKPKTLQQVYLGRKEREIAESGAYSWVADIRNRVSVARSLARNEGEFRQVLEMLDVEVADNSAKAKRADWIYSLSEAPTLKVSGERLGLLFAKETIQRDFKRAGAYHPSAKSSQELLRNARDAVLINDLASLDELSRALGTCAHHGVSSIDECDRRISSLTVKAANSEAKEGRRLLESARELEDARNYMAKNNLLPKKQPARPAHDAGRDGTKHRKGRSQERKNEQRQRRQEQQREAAQERRQR